MATTPGPAPSLTTPSSGEFPTPPRHLSPRAHAAKANRLRRSRLKLRNYLSGARGRAEARREDLPPPSRAQIAQLGDANGNVDALPAPEREFVDDKPERESERSLMRDVWRYLEDWEKEKTFGILPGEEWEGFFERDEVVKGWERGVLEGMRWERWVFEDLEEGRWVEGCWRGLVLEARDEGVERVVRGEVVEREGWRAWRVMDPGCVRVVRRVLGVKEVEVGG